MKKKILYFKQLIRYCHEHPRYLIRTSLIDHLLLFV